MQREYRMNNEEAERLRRQKERWDKEECSTREEQISSWTQTIETLEKIDKAWNSSRDFPKGKFKPKPIWTCEGNYSEEDKEYCKKEVIEILKLCKKEYILIDKPAVANSIYVNRLNKRDATRKDNSMIEKEWSEDAKRKWKKFVKTFNEDNYAQNFYREGIETIKVGLASGTIEPIITDKPLDLGEKDLQEWDASEGKKLCWLETVEILRKFGQETLIETAPRVVQHIYADRLKRMDNAPKNSNAAEDFAAEDARMVLSDVAEAVDNILRRDDTMLRRKKEEALRSIVSPPEKKRVCDSYSLATQKMGNAEKNSIATEQKREEALSELTAGGVFKNEQPAPQFKLQSDDMGNAKYINAIKAMYGRKQTTADPEEDKRIKPDNEGKTEKTLDDNQKYIDAINLMYRKRREK
jgi:hypothetical protein